MKREREDRENNLNRMAYPGHRAIDTAKSYLEKAHNPLETQYVRLEDSDDRANSELFQSKLISVENPKVLFFGYTDFLIFSLLYKLVILIFLISS